MIPAEPLAKRHYTDRQGRIRMPVVMEAADRWYAPYGPQHHVRRGTHHEQVERAMAAARRETKLLRHHPMRESIDAVDAVIARKCPDGQDSILRDSAVLAHHERRPAMVARRTNTIAMLAAFAVHQGHDLAAWIIASAEEQRRGLRWYAGQVFGALVPVNHAGAEAIEAAQWALAGEVEVERQREAA